MEQNQPATKENQKEGVQELSFDMCAQCGYPVASIKGDSHNYCQNCGFRDSCC